MLNNRFAYLILAVISVVFYLNTLTYDFVWDDRFLILENPYIQDSRLLSEGLVSDFWANYQDPRRFRNYYRPIVTLSYFVDYALWGEDPAGYHATNIFLHMANVLLVFGIGCILLRSREAAFVAAAVFAVHPVHTESVTWISGRTDLLASVFVLASVRQYLKAGKQNALASLMTAVPFSLSPYYRKKSPSCFPPHSCSTPRCSVLSTNKGSPTCVKSISRTSLSRRPIFSPEFICSKCLF